MGPAETLQLQALIGSESQDREADIRVAHEMKRTHLVHHFLPKNGEKQHAFWVQPVAGVDWRLHVMDQPALLHASSNIVMVVALYSQPGSTAEKASGARQEGCICSQLACPALQQQSAAKLGWQLTGEKGTVKMCEPPGLRMRLIS